MNLAALPSDIIRKVARIDLDSIDIMRLVNIYYFSNSICLIFFTIVMFQISPLWNKLALEHLHLILSKRKNLPVIERVRWFVFEDSKDIIIGCYVRVPCLSVCLASLLSALLFSLFRRR